MKISPQPIYDVELIKFGTDTQTFERAAAIYNAGKVTNVTREPRGVFATVQGTHLYQVYVTTRHYDEGSCNCYVGEHETLCKHMVAVALWAVLGGKPLSMQEAKPIGQPRCSQRRAKPSPHELSTYKKTITEALRFIKPYRGPSRTWFVYQDSLSEGCRRLTDLVNSLPVHVTTAALLVDLLLRLDKKLSSSGVDDSDGTVGGFMYEVAAILKQFVKLDPAC
ncbi:MAG: hypothetical protein V1895_01965, partial [Parcubacteria group bacterium]